MALTKEQIKGLKPGDKLIIPGTFCRVDKGGDIWAEIDRDYFYFSPSYVSLPPEIGNSQSSTVNSQSKYDPTRLFKKGDKVQPRSGKTVLASEYGFVTFHELEGQYEVNEDEARGTVTLIVNGHACFVSAFALELVTPVEERRPYSVETDYVDNEPVWNIYKDGDLIVGYTSCHPHAKAAAEAERDRLNDEWQTKVCGSEDRKEEV